MVQTRKGFRSSHSQKGSTDPTWDSHGIWTTGPGCWTEQNPDQNESSQRVSLASLRFAQETLSLIKALGGRTGASTPGAKGDSLSQQAEIWSHQEKHLQVSFIWFGPSCV